MLGGVSWCESQQSGKYGERQPCHGFLQRIVAWANAFIREPSITLMEATINSNIRMYAHFSMLGLSGLESRPCTSGDHAQGKGREADHQRRRRKQEQLCVFMLKAC